MTPNDQVVANMVSLLQNTITNVVIIKVQPGMGAVASIVDHLPAINRLELTFVSIADLEATCSPDNKVKYVLIEVDQSYFLDSMSEKRAALTRIVNNAHKHNVKIIIKSFITLPVSVRNRSHFIDLL